MSSLAMAIDTSSGYPSDWDEVGAEPEKSGRDHAAEWRVVRDKRAVQARILRDELIVQMGGECVLCHSDEDLSFDHPHGRTWDLRSKNQLQRMRLYLRDFAAGNLRLLCGSCNSSVRPKKKET